MSQSLVGTSSLLRLDVKASILSGAQPKPYDTADNADAPEFARQLSRFFHAMSDGAYSFAITETQGGVAAQATITIASTGPTNGETCTIGNKTLTAKTSGANPAAGEFNISSTPKTVAASFVTAVNTYCVGICSASNALGVITLTASAVGNIGNGIQASMGTLANTTLTHAFGTSVAGAGTIYSSACGF